MGWTNSSDESESTFSYGRGGYSKSEDGIERDCHGTILNSIPVIPIEEAPRDWALVLAQAAIEWRNERMGMDEDDLAWELSQSLIYWSEKGKVPELMTFLKSRGWDQLEDTLEQICAIELFHYEPCNLAC